MRIHFKQIIITNLHIKTLYQHIHKKFRAMNILLISNSIQLYICSDKEYT